MELDLGLGLRPAYIPSITLEASNYELINNNNNSNNNNNDDDDSTDNGIFHRRSKKLGVTRENNYHVIKRQRNFDEAFEKYEEEAIDGNKTTLSLLLWSGQPNEEDHDSFTRASHTAAYKQDDEEEDQREGWPPINSWRKKLLLQYGQGGGSISNDINADQRGNNGNYTRRNGSYVKVKMEGVGIGRKIDLNLYDSYQSLTTNLLQMFSKYMENEDDDAQCITVVYQDKEGDWSVAGDLPWHTFTEAVQRIEILRNGDV